jgi:hypothetical protein
MALKVEVIVDGGMHAQKALGDRADLNSCISMRLSVGTIVALDHALLHLACTAWSIHDTVEFDQHAIAGGLDDTAVMLGDTGIDQLDTDRLEPLESTGRRLVAAAHAAPRLRKLLDRLLAEAADTPLCVRPATTAWRIASRRAPQCDRPACGGQ